MEETKARAYVCTIIHIQIVIGKINMYVSLPTISNTN